MNARRRLSVVALLASAASASGFQIDFENGTDGQLIAGVPGVTFTQQGQETWRYGDSRTGNYNTRSIDLGYGNGSYQHYGNLWAWLGASTGGGTIDFTNNDGTWFQTGYASYSSLYLEAFDSSGNLIASTSGGYNCGASDLCYLRVDAPTGQFIDYVRVHDSGNYFLLDNMSGDASGVNVPDGGSTVALLGISMCGLGALSRLRRKEPLSKG